MHREYQCWRFRTLSAQSQNLRERFRIVAVACVVGVAAGVAAAAGDAAAAAAAAAAAVAAAAAAAAAARIVSNAGGMYAVWRHEEDERRHLVRTGMRKCEIEYVSRIWCSTTTTVRWQ